MGTGRMGTRKGGDQEGWGMRVVGQEGGGGGGLNGISEQIGGGAEDWVKRAYE